MQLKKINELIKNPSKLSNIFLRSYNNFRKKKLWNLFDEALPSNEKILRNKQGETILIEGLWDNPNQFFRLSLFLDALTKSENKNVIALLIS